MHGSFTLQNWHETHRLLADSVLHGLLLGSTSKPHLLHLANESAMAASGSQGATRQLHLCVALDCLLNALEQDPLDPLLVGSTLSLERHCGLLSPQIKSILGLLQSWCEKSRELSNGVRGILHRQGLARQYGGKELPPFHELLQQLLYDQGSEGLQVAWAVLQVLDEQNVLSRSGELWPVALKLQADIHFLRGELPLALACQEKVAKVFPELVLERRCQTLLRLGRRQEAMDALLQLVATRPWRCNMALKLFDLHHEHDRGLAAAQKTSVLLYSYNHAQDLDRTLESLAASSAAGCDVFVLNNGSTDHTGQVLNRWQESGAFPSLQLVHLPVNIGAPAARNWLLRLDKVRANPWVAYLDDDVLLPKDWLERLLYAAGVCPEAGVWGAKVCDYANVPSLQQVDQNLCDPQHSDSFMGFSDLQLLTADAGQFDYLRPAASVTGCCHLFRREVFETVGEFDIRFSPSQYDDVDHGLRLIQAGMHSCYTGHARIEHLRVSGAAAETGRASRYNVLGNLKKLEGKYDEAARKELVARMNRVLLEDCMQKTNDLSRLLS